MKKLTLIIMILGMITIANAQIEKNELIPTREIEEMVATKLKNEPVENFYRYGIKNKEQFENLQLGRVIREYKINIDSDTLIPEGWRVPILYEGKALFLAFDFGGNMYFGLTKMREGMHYYESEDLMGIVMIRGIPPCEFYYIRREHKDVFVQAYDPPTRQYFKNEYSLSELIVLRDRVLELELRDADFKEKRQKVPEFYGTNQVNENDIFDTHFPLKHELKMTPELTEKLATEIYWDFMDDPDWELSNFGITNRAQLENLQLGKPIPSYRIDIDNENLIFTHRWHLPVMSDGEPFYTANVEEIGGQYLRTGGGVPGMAKISHNYEHKDLIIGYIELGISGKNYYIIRRENKVVFLQVYDPATREYFKNEYSFSELINLLKK